MLIPDTIQDLNSLKAFLNRELSSFDNRLNNLDRGRGSIKLFAPLNANNFPIKNLPGPQRDPNNAITKSEASLLSPIPHSGTHENGGSDEISVTGLSGLLADEQTPLDHEHTNGIGDGGNIPSSSVLFNGASETVEQILEDSLNNGILDLITLSDDGGLNISWSPGEIYDQSQAVPVIETDAGSDACTDNAVNFLVYKPGSGSTLVLQNSRADINSDEIDIGHFHAQAGDIWGNPHQESILSEKETNISDGLANVFPIIVTSGLIVSEHAGGGTWDVDCTQGQYYHDGHEGHNVNAIDSTVTQIVRHYKSGGTWATDNNNEIDPANWNNGTNKAAVTAAKWYRSLFIIAPNNVIHWVYPDTEYISLNAALVGLPASIPPGLVGFPTSTEIILRGSDVAFPAAGSDQWIDARIILGAVTSGPITDHANLSSLNWGAAGHTIDTDIPMVTNKIIGLGNADSAADAMNLQMTIAFILALSE
jgi:hypothetical protein